MSSQTIALFEYSERNGRGSQQRIVFFNSVAIQSSIHAKDDTICKTYGKHM